MNPIQKPLKEEIKRIATEYNIDPFKIEEIENAMWDFVRTEMSRGEKNVEDSFENIYLRYLGTFHVRKGMIKYLRGNANDQ